MEKIVVIHGFKWFINQVVWMYYLDDVDHNSMAAQLTRSDCEGF